MSKSRYNDLLRHIANKDQDRVDAYALVRTNPAVAAVYSKFRRDPTIDGVRDSHGQLTTGAVNGLNLNAAAFETAGGIRETETVMQMHPDLLLGAQILTSSVLAPKDMVTVELTHQASKCPFPSNVTSQLVQKVVEYLDSYKIKDELPKILYSILITAGSYPIAVIPENSLDELINGTTATRLGTESYGALASSITSHRGILGPSTKTPTEVTTLAAAFESTLGLRTATVSPQQEMININGLTGSVSIHDNPLLLAMPRIVEAQRANHVNSILKKRPGFEGYHDQFEGDVRVNSLTPNQIMSSKTGRTTPIRPVLTKELLTRRSIGGPLVMVLPPESVRPVFVPGVPDNHIGYLVLMDGEGNPLSLVDRTDIYAEMGRRLQSNSSFVSQLNQRTQDAFSGVDFANPGAVDHAARVYASMVEEDIASRLKNGIYGSTFSLADDNNDFYRTMLARSLKGDRTTILYIPANMLSYFAIKYNRDGTGCSLMQDTRMVNSLRSIVTLANINTSVRNSISRTKVSTTLSPKDNDPFKTIEMIKHQILRARSTGIPTGTSNPNDITTWLQRSAYEFEFSGSDKIPEMKIDFSEGASSHAKPDPDLEEMLRRKSLMGMHLTPEIVDDSGQVDFASSITARNLLLSKRVVQIQDQFLPGLNEYLRMLVGSSETVCFRLREIVTTNLAAILKAVPSLVDLAKREFDLDLGNAEAPVGNDPKPTDIKVNAVPDNAAPEAAKEKTKPFEFTDGHKQIAFTNFLDIIVEMFLEHFEVSLPRPNSATIKTQKEYMDDFIAALDLLLDEMINEDFLTSDTSGEELSGKVGIVKAIVRSHFIRAEAVKIGMLPDLFELSATDDDGRPKVNLVDEYVQHINNITRTMNYFMDGIRPVRDAADKVNEGLDGGGTGGSTETSTGDDGVDGGNPMNDPDAPDDTFPELPDMDAPVDGANPETTAGAGENSDKADKGANPETDKPAEEPDNPDAEANKE